MFAQYAIYLLLAIRSCEAVQVIVNSNQDISLDNSGCYPTTPGNCTLRNAVSYCMSASAADCDIVIPERMDIALNADFGAIIAKTYSTVRISIAGSHSRITPTARATQLFRFDGLGSPSFRVSLRDLTLSGFGLPAARGGTVFVNYLTEFQMTGVSVDDSFGEVGGVLYASYSRGVAIANCSFTNNKATGAAAASATSFPAMIMLLTISLH